jgi:hypothetical protein
MRKTTSAVVAGLLLLQGGCEHGAPSAAHTPLPAQGAPAALSPAARARLSGSFDLSRLPNILFTSTIHFRAVWGTCRRE